MSQQVLDFIKTIPLGGGYTWDPKKNAHGVPENIVYQGELILRKDTATYCTGLTFWVWFELFGKHLDISVDAMRLLQRRWYCAAGNRGGCQDALIAINQGTKQTLDTAQPGDFLQLWRTSGSGHSVVYMDHDRFTLKYWSTQPKTKGVGERAENLSIMTELYFVRPLEPVTP